MVSLKNTQVHQTLTGFLVAIATEPDGRSEMLGVIIEGVGGGRGEGGGETTTIVRLQALTAVI